MPCMSAGRRPSRGGPRGSRCRPNRSAASAHWSFRCGVGATTTTRRPGCSPRSWRAAVSANGGLAGARCGHREEVRSVLERERVERLGLPGPEPDAGGSDRGGARSGGRVRHGRLRGGRCAASLACAAVHGQVLGGSGTVSLGTSAGGSRMVRPGGRTSCSVHRKHPRTCSCSLTRPSGRRARRPGPRPSDGCATRHPSASWRSPRSPLLGQGLASGRSPATPTSCTSPRHPDLFCSGQGTTVDRHADRAAPSSSAR